MIAYLLKTFLYYVSIFLGIITFAFLLFHVIPSDPARTILGPLASESQVNELRDKMGLNEPVYRQITQYLINLVRLDFGRSFVDDRNVYYEVRDRFKVTLSLISVSTIIIVLYLFIIVTTYLSQRILILTNIIDFLISSLPVFFSGILVALITLYLYPMSFFPGYIRSITDFLYFIPPAFVLGLYPMAILSGILKRELSIILKSFYVQSEKALGFSDIIILYKYALKNALIPILSALSNILPVLLTGSFIVEIIFSIPGIGSVLIKSILERDFPMIEGITLVQKRV